MTEKLRTARCSPDQTDRVIFRCPGCKDNHQVKVADGWWTWNGSVESPTFGGSVLVRGPMRSNPTDGQGVCHSYVTDGRIQYLQDCTHALVGQVVDLPTWPPTRMETT